MRIIRIDPFSQPLAVNAIAIAYQQAFGGDPWNEGFSCPICKAIFPRTGNLTMCPECEKRSESILLVDAWPMNQIISDFYAEMKKDDSICIVAKINKHIVGFAWGYQVSANPDLDSYLDAPGVHASLQGTFFYLDECALIPSYQGKGIGKKLVQHIFREQEEGQILLRTLNNSRMQRIIKGAGGAVIQHISRERVIMKLTLPSC